MDRRKIPATVFGLILGSLSLYILLNAYFPRLQTGATCADSVPETSAQRSALEDARSRAAETCNASGVRCQFTIQDLSNFEGLIRIRHEIVEPDLFEGCIYKDRSLDGFVYSSDGKFVRTEGAPYG